MINQEDLLNMWAKDVDVLRSDDIKGSAVDVHGLHSKYLTLYMNTRAEKVMYLNRYRELTQELDDYYSGKAEAHVYKERPQPKEIKTRAGIEKAIAADPKMLKLQTKIDLCDILVDGLSEILRDVAKMHFTVTNLVNELKIKNGIV